MFFGKKDSRADVSEAVKQPPQELLQDVPTKRALLQAAGKTLPEHSHRLSAHLSRSKYPCWKNSDT
jgi:hypothetical protein